MGTPASLIGATVTAGGASSSTAASTICTTSPNSLPPVIAVGSRVQLGPGQFRSGGVLDVGDTGTVVEINHPWTKIRAESGSKIGRMWSYGEGRLVLVPSAISGLAVTTAALALPHRVATGSGGVLGLDSVGSSGDDSGRSINVSPERIPLGSVVTVVDGFMSIGQAQHGPLALGDTGVLIQDDLDHQPYKVSAILPLQGS